MKVKKLITAIWLIMVCVPAWARPEEIFRLEIPAEAGGMARAVRSDGQIKELGKVLRAPTATRYPGYTASAWAEPGTVAATAVNAIHLTVSVEN